MVILCLFFIFTIFIIFPEEITTDFQTEEYKPEHRDSLFIEQKILEAFEEIMLAADEEFTNIAEDSEKVQIDSSKFKKILLHFPEADYSFRRQPTLKDSVLKTNYSFTINFNRNLKKKNILLENALYEDIYQELANEIGAFHKIEISGKWKFLLNSKEIRMLWNKDPAFKVFVKPSGTTGVQIIFKLSK